MAGKPCAKCGKSVGWISQNKIEGVIYCEDCWKELKQGKKEAGKELEQLIHKIESTINSL